MPIVNPKVKRAVQGAQSVSTVEWNFEEDGSGEPVTLTDFADRSIQVAGLFGGGTLALEGSNDGEDWFTLRDPQGVSLAFTTANLRQILEATLLVRPTLIGSAGASVKVIMCARAANPKSWS